MCKCIDVPRSVNRGAMLAFTSATTIATRGGIASGCENRKARGEAQRDTHKCGQRTPANPHNLTTLHKMSATPFPPVQSVAFNEEPCHHRLVHQTLFVTQTIVTTRRSCRESCDWRMFLTRIYASVSCGCDVSAGTRNTQSIHKTPYSAVL